MILREFRRQEYKYLLKINQPQQLGRFFLGRGLVAENYFVGSLYLDTADYRFYWEKQYGVERRTKYRLRTYSVKPSPKALVFWEIKHKYLDYIYKERTVVPWTKTQKLLGLSAGTALTAKELADEAVQTQFYISVLQKQLRPSIFIGYRRQVWHDPYFPGFRVTFDSKIEAESTTSLFSRRRRPVLPGAVIMELKFSGQIPDYWESIIQSYNLSRQALSKYCLALEACDIVSEEIR